MACEDRHRGFLAGRSGHGGCMSDHPLWLFADQLGPHVHGGAAPPSRGGDRRVVGRARPAPLPPPEAAPDPVGPAPPGRRARRPGPAAADDDVPRGPRAGRPAGRGPRADVDARPTRSSSRCATRAWSAEILPTPTFALSTGRLRDVGRVERPGSGWATSTRPSAGASRSCSNPTASRPAALELRRRQPGAAAEGRRPRSTSASRGGPTEDDIDAEVRRDLDRAGPADGRASTGPAGSPSLAARRWRPADHFLRHRLGAFGPYEDAILAGDWTMAHSLLSVPLNLGLLRPARDALRPPPSCLPRTATVELDAAEGFVRQVIGWREYVWHLVLAPRPRLPHGATRCGRPAQLPDWFADLDADTVDGRLPAQRRSPACATAAGCTTSSG